MQPDASNTLNIPDLARAVWHDFSRTRRALILYEIVFRLAEAWLLVPVVPGYSR